MTTQVLVDLDFSTELFHVFKYETSLLYIQFVFFFLSGKFSCNESIITGIFRWKYNHVTSILSAIRISLFLMSCYSYYIQSCSCGVLCFFVSSFLSFLFLFQVSERLKYFLLILNLNCLFFIYDVKA